jgi:TrmH family RNA methyltransferase
MKLLTLARDLQRRKARERHQRFVAEGVRTVETLLLSPLEVVGVLATAALAADERGARLLATAARRGIPVHELSEKELESAADTDSPQGVLAIAEVPVRTLGAPPDIARLLVLDALQDPGNVGTVIRTAAALGVTATVALPGTVDLWNAKVVRSTMGALFVHPAMPATWEAVCAYLDAHTIPLWVADTGGEAVDDSASHPVPHRLALAVSNEGAGLSAHVAERAARRVAIRMAPEAESLNVAVATGILIHALRPT